MPLFDSSNPLHASLAQLGSAAQQLAAGLQLPITRFEKKRRYVREQIQASAIGPSVEAAVRTLLGDAVVALAGRA